MKANFENLKKALEICAKAHNANLKDWSEDGQMGIDKECIPVLADVRAIGEAFYPENEWDAEASYGYVTLWISDVYRDEVNIDTLEMALPYGSLEQLKD